MVLYRIGCYSEPQVVKLEGDRMASSSGCRHITPFLVAHDDRHAIRFGPAC